MSDVDPTLIATFNRAADAGRRGDHEGSMALYRQVLEAAATEPRPAASLDFLVTARMRIGFCLLDLGRLDEARGELEQALAHRHSVAAGVRYELEFAYGNTLGALGDHVGAFHHLVEAISAAEDEDDYVRRPGRCWSNILAHGARAGAWGWVAEKAEIALTNARLRGNPTLEREAQARLAEARAHLA